MKKFLRRLKPRRETATKVTAPSSTVKQLAVPVNAKPEKRTAQTAQGDKAARTGITTDAAEVELSSSSFSGSELDYEDEAVRAKRPQIAAKWGFPVSGWPGCARAGRRYDGAEGTLKGPKKAELLQMLWDTNSGQFALVPEAELSQLPLQERCDRYLSASSLVTSKKLLHRLSSCFDREGSSQGREKLKQALEVVVVHQESGYELSFVNGKAGAHFWPSSWPANESDPRALSFQKDVLELINTLSSNVSRH